MADKNGMSGCCGSCYWFQPEPDDEYMEWGDCLVDSPTAHTDGDLVIGVWPSVEATHHHCGKYTKVHNDN